MYVTVIFSISQSKRFYTYKIKHEALRAKHLSEMQLKYIKTVVHLFKQLIIKVIMLGINLVYTNQSF